MQSRQVGVLELNGAGRRWADAQAVVVKVPAVKEASNVLHVVAIYPLTTFRGVPASGERNNNRWQKKLVSKIHACVVI